MMSFEMQYLAGAALGLTDEQTEEIMDGDEDFDTPLLERFGVDFEQFSVVSEALLKLTPAISFLHSGKLGHAFVRIVQGRYEVIIQTPIIEGVESE